MAVVAEKPVSSRNSNLGEFRSLKEVQHRYRPKAVLREQGVREATAVGLELAKQSLSLVRQAVEPSPRPR
jgi:hypothetical protein